MSEKFLQKKYVTVCSEKTLQSNDKGFFMQFAEAATSNAGEKWIKNVFGKLAGDKERLRCVYRDAAVKEVVLGTMSHVQEIYRKKNAEVSQARRMNAEKLAKNGEHQKALILYGQSVLRAPKTGENPRDNGISLALAYWARSETLMHLKLYTSALNDIQLALKEGLHNTFKAEAFWRMAICYKAQGEEKRANVSADLAEKLMPDLKKVELLRQSITKEYQQKKTTDRRTMPKISETNPNNKCISKKVAIKEDKARGRFATAARHIQTGETVICEEPYAACLLPDCFGTHCHHCFERFESPVGCPDCCSVAFCKAECRDAALKSYHNIECKYLDLLIGSGMSILSHLALRMVTQNSPERMLEIYKNRNLESVYNLCTLSANRAPEDHLQRTLMAAFLLRCLQKSGYFGYVDDNVSPNENQLAIGELILFNLQMLQFNAHEIYETKHSEEHRFRSATAAYIGVAVYPTAALFNHGCYTGVSRHFVGKNIVLTTVCPLNQGEEIYENYGPIFTRRSLPERQKYLAGRYWFKCNCLACNQDWPSLESGLSQLSGRIRCPTLNCANFFTLPLANDTVKCPKCQQTVSLTLNWMQLKFCEDQYALGFNCLENEQPEKGIKIICQAIDSFMKVSAAPHKDTHLAQECLRAFYADSGNAYEVPKQIN